MMLTRRALVKDIAMSTAWVGCGHLLVPRHAFAADISLRDRIDLVYSNRFHFNARGEPLISVGLLEGQDVVRLSADRGLNVLPSGDGGTSIEGGRRFEIRIERGHAAQQSFSIVLDELVAPSAAKIERTIATWSRRGIDADDHEIGTVFGVGGRVMDNRRFLITTGRYASDRVAREQLKILQKTFDVPGKLHPLVHARSHGRMLAIDLDHGTKILADGVLWFSSTKGPATVITDSRTPAQRYRGAFYVAVDRHGKLALANLVSESELLAGLVPAEIFASAPMAALRAQAVAARGQLVAKVGTRHTADPYLLCARQHCQVYAGLEREHSQTTKAVAQTAGWVVMRPSKTQLVDTVYSANSGGHTEDNDHVWPGAPDPQLRGRLDPLAPAAFSDLGDEDRIRAWLQLTTKTYSYPHDAQSHAGYRWTAVVAPETLRSSLGPASIGTINGLRVTRRGRSGRATALEVIGTKRSVEVTGELRIRRALGNLRSSLFIVEPTRDRSGRFVLTGGGHGHGVGMCQHGAMGMARAGLSYRAIIAHYYANARIQKLW